ncbi:MAG TPA: DEAD/DEAH box helicase [Mycobacteriales bacterium]|nr:DEAD/DEAH box helicase [Mycobacteriales bacterium]
MASPAERYTAARRRTGHPALRAFSQNYEFPFDEFQQQACEALEDGHGVLLAAPTGAGKTIVGEFAAHLALSSGGKCFYTTPIKALSNQKYHDLVERHGSASVGLLTGDNAVNGDAPVVVMTTEVLRNMLYAQSPALRGLSYVVMDEVHYLADRFRGAVWEEVILHLPDRVTLVSLSATVSNAEEFGDWLQEVRGDTTVIVEEHRPVPLWQEVLVGRRLYDLFVDDDQETVNPALSRLAGEEARFARVNFEQRPPRGGRRPPRSRVDVPSRPEVVETLDRAGLLPAIVFVFSRNGCDAAVRQCLRGGLRLAEPPERRRIRDVLDERVVDIPDEDLAVLGFGEFSDALQRGIASHHAGMLPIFKEIVEQLFSEGLVKVVFATETLALGINMPARSVVLESLVKWNGEAHVDLSPGEYTQLTGRAGRRGIDVEGHGVVLWTPGFDPKHVAGLASTRTYPLRSSFRPSYNMAVNLVDSLGRHEARELLEQSFAQFQADRAVVGLARQQRRNEEALSGYREGMHCHLGDFEEYAGLRRSLKDRESSLAREGAAQRRAAAAQSLDRLHVGDVIRVPAGRRPGLAVVIDPHGGATAGDPHPVVLTVDRQVKRLSVVDFPTPVETLTRVRLPKGFNPRSPQSRRDLASTLRNLGLDADAGRPKRGRAAAADDAEIARLRAAIRRHPCHGCADREEHARWAERYDRLRRDTDQLERRVESRTNTIARMFDRVCGMLEGLGYLSGDAVTPAGRTLARIYSEADLVIAEALRTGMWDDLDAAELASVCSSLVYEARRDDDPTPRLPSGRVRAALTELSRLWATLKTAEHDARLDFLREPDAGFAWASWRWARGEPLDQVLLDTGQAPGDFVRWMKQLIDLLDQVVDAAASESNVARNARAAVAAVRRGVVAYSGVA